MPASVELFSKYPNRWFVETGTFNGVSVEMALEAGFQHIRSVEMSEPLHKKAVERLGHHPNVQLYLGDSRERLADMTADINEPITFWLDAHGCMETDCVGDTTSTPVVAELAVIARHPRNDHTILIDDMRCCENRWPNVLQQDIIDACLKVNPMYSIHYEPSVTKHDILVARLK